MLPRRYVATAVKSGLTVVTVTVGRWAV